jgi:hypothetical protein
MGSKVSGRPWLLPVAVSLFLGSSYLEARADAVVPLPPSATRLAEAVSAREPRSPREGFMKNWD